MREQNHVVTAVQFTPAGDAERQTGLLGWVTCVLGDLLRLDGIAVRRTRVGRLALSFPRGRGKHPPVRPSDDEARRAIERQIFDAIGLDGGGER